MLWVCFGECFVAFACEGNGVSGGWKECRRRELLCRFKATQWLCVCEILNQLLHFPRYYVPLQLTGAGVCGGGCGDDPARGRHHQVRAPPEGGVNDKLVVRD